MKSFSFFAALCAALVSLTSFSVSVQAGEVQYNAHECRYYRDMVEMVPNGTSPSARYAREAVKQCDKQDRQARGKPQPVVAKKPNPWGQVFGAVFKQ